MIKAIQNEVADLAQQLLANYVLAIDQATNTSGWALFKDEKLTDYGVVRGNGDQEQRIEQMRQWLHNKIEECKFIPNSNLSVAIEDIQLQANAVQTFKTLAHLQGVMINELYNQKVEYAIYYASEWKSTLHIKGKDRTAQKKNAQNLIKELYGKTIIQDTCDAICIGLHHLKHNNQIIELNFE